MNFYGEIPEKRCKASWGQELSELSQSFATGHFLRRKPGPFCWSCGICGAHFCWQMGTIFQWFQPGTCLPTSRLWSSMHRTTTSDTWSLAGGTLSRKQLCKAKKAKNTTQHCRGHLFAAAHLAISFWGNKHNVIAYENMNKTSTNSQFQLRFSSTL